MAAPQKRARTPPLAIDPSLEGQRADGPASHAAYGATRVGQPIDQPQPAAKRRGPAAFQVNASLERAHTAYEAPLQVYGWPEGMAAATAMGPVAFAANPLFGLPAGPSNPPAALIPAGPSGSDDAYRLDQASPYLESSVLEKALAYRAMQTGTSVAAPLRLAEQPQLPTPPPLPPTETPAAASDSPLGESDAPPGLANPPSAAGPNKDPEASPMDPADAFNRPPDPFDDTAGAFPDRADFDLALEAYLHKLHPIKRNKALSELPWTFPSQLYSDPGTTRTVPRDLYDTVLEILRKPLDTKVGDSQLRFWARQRFRLMEGPNDDDCVLHEGKRVVLRDEIYDVLAAVHESSQHGGRDRTYATLRERWSYVPKEIVTSFIKLCPTCNGKRVTDKQIPRDGLSKKRRSKPDDDNELPTLPSLPSEQPDPPAPPIDPQLYGLPEGLVKAFASCPTEVAPSQPPQSNSAIPPASMPAFTPSYGQAALSVLAEPTHTVALAAGAAVVPVDNLPDSAGQQVASILDTPAYATFVTAAATAAAQAAEQG